jgi:hypothetical protein
MIAYPCLAWSSALAPSGHPAYGGNGLQTRPGRGQQDGAITSIHAPLKPRNRLRPLSVCSCRQCVFVIVVDQGTFPMPPRCFKSLVALDA